MKAQIKAVQDLLIWLRKERISYHTLTVGNVTLEGVVDGKHLASVAKTDKPKRNMYEVYGEELLKQPVPAAEQVPEEALLDD